MDHLDLKTYCFYVDNISAPQIDFFIRGHFSLKHKRVWNTVFQTIHSYLLMSVKDSALCFLPLSAYGEPWEDTPNHIILLEYASRVSGSIREVDFGYRNPRVGIRWPIIRNNTGANFVFCPDGMNPRYNWQYQLDRIF